MTEKQIIPGATLATELTEFGGADQPSEYTMPSTVGPSKAENIFGSEFAQILGVLGPKEGMEAVKEFSKEKLKQGNEGFSDIGKLQKDRERAIKRGYPEDHPYIKAIDNAMNKKSEQGGANSQLVGHTSDGRPVIFNPKTNLQTVDGQPYIGKIMPKVERVERAEKDTAAETAKKVEATINAKVSTWEKQLGRKLSAEEKRYMALRDLYGIVPGGEAGPQPQGTPSTSSGGYEYRNGKLVKK